MGEEINTLIELMLEKRANFDFQIEERIVDCCQRKKLPHPMLAVASYQILSIDTSWNTFVYIPTGEKICAWRTTEIQSTGRGYSFNMEFIEY